MHRHKIEAAEARVGIRFQEADSSAKFDGEPPFKIGDLVAKGSSRIRLGGCLMLRKAIHTYMAFANAVPCLHFNWNDETNSAEFSALGKRFIACIDLYQKQILDLDNEAGVEKTWNSDVYAESAYVRIFRKVLVRAADEIRKKRNSEYLSNIKLKFEETEALQRSLQGALALMNRPRARRLNKHLYGEMFNTESSIKTYLTTIKNTDPGFGVLPITLSFSSEQRHRLSSVNPSLKILPRGSFPRNYLDYFEHVLAFASALKKKLNKEVVGNLVKLTGENTSDPQCELLLFITQQTCSNIELLKLHVHLIWADHVFGVKDKDFRDIPSAPGIKINRLIEISGSSKGSDALFNLVDREFIQELKYQRLRLPKGRRSWG